MARGSKASYGRKQKRMASKIEKSAKESGKSSKTAERIAWATVNKKTKKKTSKKKTSKKKASRKKASKKKASRK